MEARGRMASKNLRILIVVILILLTAQGWTGDFANLFAVFPTGSFSGSMTGFLQALDSAGIIVIYHAVEGAMLIAISAGILVLSFKSSNSTSLRSCAILGLGTVVAAAMGGILFVSSNFTNNANSAQMGGSFIGAYAFFFMTLYFTKG